MRMSPRDKVFIAELHARAFWRENEWPPAFCEVKTTKSSEINSEQTKFFVSVDGNCFYIRIFYIFYKVCPLVWNIYRERGKENEKVGGKQAKLNESESGREPEKGGKILLTSSGRGIEKGGAI